MPEVTNPRPVRVKSFKAGTTVFKEGDPGTEMYVLLKGVVELSVRGKVIARVGKAGLFGEMAIIDNNPRSATAHASTNCEVVVVDQKRFLEMVHETPDFAIDVMRVLVSRLRLTDEAMRRGMGP